MKKHLLTGLATFALSLVSALADYQGWSHSGALTILTTPDGANLPASAELKDFPLLVRLDKDWFDFQQAKPNGEDVRFSSGTGAPLPYQIEEWDAPHGTASIWVRIPVIKGDARQEIRIHWGKADAASESDGKAVFNESNGYLSVWHMNDPVRDDAGTIPESKDEGTTPVRGIIGPARHLAGKQGIAGGENITAYPSGTGPMTTEAWFRAEQTNGTVLAWGKEQRPGKVMMNFLSPPRIDIQCYFADVEAKTPLATHQWYHVVHTYADKDSRVYINGQLDGASTPVLDIPKTSSLWIGGWYRNYNFIGDIDEVRISKVVRSADWVRLQYENQKPLQTAVGPLIGQAVLPNGEDFPSIWLPKEATVMEGKSAVFTIHSRIAQKLYWSVIREGKETVVAVDRFKYTFDAGRVTGDTKATLRLKAVYPGEVKTQDIPILIKEDIADPEFTLSAPAAWDGRSTIIVVPQETNRAAMQAKGADNLKVEWSVSPFAVTKEIIPGVLRLRRAQQSGPLTVTATLSNGGAAVSHSVVIHVTEPQADPWEGRAPGKDEKPEDGQFYARDDKNEGTLFYNGTLADTTAEEVFLEVVTGGPVTTITKRYNNETQKPAADGSYAFTIKLKPGLTKYRVVFGTKKGGQQTVLNTVDNIVCGDAYLIQGQSNAVSTDWGREEPPDFHSEWIRSFGTTGNGPKGEHLWGEANYRGPGGKLTIGYWPMELARRLVEDEKMPICIINGAVGGTRIDQHQRNEADHEDMTTIYGRLLWRVREARLTHGVRGLFWHQGENDQGADGPTGGYGWEAYRRLFLDLAAAWKQDYPNLQRYTVFQIWPKACSMGIAGSDNRLREVQRQLPTAFSHMSIMSTLGIEPPGPCHFPPAGYVEFARQLCPLVETDFYGKLSPTPQPPNLVGAGFPDGNGAGFPDGKKDTIVLLFDQPVKWDDSLCGQFYLDGEKDQVVSGSIKGDMLVLKLAAPTAAKTITYLDSAHWSQKTLLRGVNGLAALTFCEVPLGVDPAFYQMPARFLTRPLLTPPPPPPANR